MSKRFFIFAVAFAAVAAWSACSSDKDTPLGSQFIGDLLGSRPGTVFKDTIPITSGDTAVAFYTLLANRTALELGRGSGYERNIVLRADFSKPGADVGREVETANLRLLFADAAETRDIQAFFYRLGTAYSEGDSISSLDTLGVIVDPETSDPLRTMALITPNYALPPALVQGWIRGDSVHNGIAVVFTNLADDKVIRFSSSESSNAPYIQVRFKDETSSNYRITHDANLVRAVQSTSNLIISDGFVRRLYFPVDLSQVNDSAAVHYAFLRFNFVPGTTFGSNQSVQLYVPNSPDPLNPAFRSGQLVTQKTLNSSSGILEMPVTNVLLMILGGKVPDNGFVLRFSAENSEIKQAEFYPSSNDSLRPRVFMTYSTPAGFDE